MRALGCSSAGVPQGSMVKDTVPWTCLRAGQSRVADTSVGPALLGKKYSLQIKEESLGIRLRAARMQLGSEIVVADSDDGNAAHL